MEPGTEKIVCPSGLTGIVRKLKVKEVRSLTDRNLQKRGGSIGRLLESCWLETLDRGPYPGEVNAPLDWNLILQGDRVYAMIQLGRLSYPDQPYEFAVPCAFCGKRIDWSVDVNDLPVFDLPQESFDAIQAGQNRFTATASTGERVTFRLLVGADEAKIPEFTETHPERMLELSLSLKIVEIEGVNDGARMDWIKDLDLDVLQDLADKFEEVDCGVETAIDIRCGSFSCGSEQEIEIPFGLPYLVRTGGSRSRKGKRKGRRLRSR